VKKRKDVFADGSRVAMSGLFEVLAASPDEEKIAQQQAQDRLAAAVYDVREAYGDFLFKAASIYEFRTRVALIKGSADQEIYKIVDRHLRPVTGVMRHIIGRDGVLEKEFRSRQGDATYTEHGPKIHEVRTEDPHGREWSGFFESPERARQWAERREEGGPYDPIPPGGTKNIAMLKGAPFAGYDDFADCTSKNSDKNRPDAYCGEIKHQVEGSAQYLGWHAIEADGTEGAVDTEETYRPSGGALIPEGDWPAFQDSVTQPAESKMEDHVFVPGEHDKSYGDTSGADFAPKSAAGLGGPGKSYDPDEPVNEGWHSRYKPFPPNYVDPDAVKDWGTSGLFGREPEERLDESEPLDWSIQPPDWSIRPPSPKRGSTLVLRYLGFCYRNNLSPTLARLERHGKQLSPSDYLRIADALSKLAALPPESKNRVGQIVRWAETYQGEGEVEDKSGPFAGPHGSFPVGTPKDLNDAKSVCNFPSVKAKNPGACRSVEKRQKPAARHQAGDVPPMYDTGEPMYDDEYLQEERRLDQAAEEERLEQKRKQRAQEQERRYPWAGGKEGPDYFGPLPHNARRRYAAPDYLQKANEALTNLLNQRAEDFQSTIAPLQQALQVVQQSQVVEQAQNPMQVQPPAGTVNVLPDQPQMPGGDAGVNPAADQSAPPPAAGDMGMGGPPQMAASRAGGHPKGRSTRGRG